MIRRFLFIILLVDFSNINAQICFNPRTNFTVGVNPKAFCIADFNGDGKKDIAIAENNGTVAIILGNGLGGFGTATDFPVGVIPNGICSADFNHDSLADIATSDLGPWNVSIIFGDGTGNFGTDSTFGANTPYSIVSADFNRDGNADLAVATAYRVLIALGNGAGGFSPVAAYGNGHSYNSIISGDFNGDTIPDLAMSGSSNMVWTLIGDGLGGFGNAIGYTVGNTPSGVIGADFNGDGKIDLVTANRFSNDITIYLGDGLGGFGSNINFPAGTGPAALCSADFDGDGNLDVAVADGSSANISLLQGDGSGNFALPVNYVVDTVPDAITSADFNGDGKPDLAVLTVYSNIDTGHVAILLNCSSTGINSVSQQLQPIKIYPNPGKGIFNMEINSNEINPAHLEIFNVLGELVYSQNNLQSSISNKIDLHDLHSGIYIAKIYSSGKIFAQNIIIE